MKVFVYFNLHKKVWSVKALEGPRKGLVIQHAKELSLRDVKFKVSKAGRERVLREKRKNVHAGIEGYIVDNVSDVITWSKMVSYNPYKADHFYCKETNEPVFNAQRVFMAERTVWAH